MTLIAFIHVLLVVQTIVCDNQILRSETDKIHLDTDKCQKYNFNVEWYFDLWVGGLSKKVKSWINCDLLLAGLLSELTRNGNLVC